MSRDGIPILVDGIPVLVDGIPVLADSIPILVDGLPVLVDGYTCSGAFLFVQCFDILTAEIEIEKP